MKSISIPYTNAQFSGILNALEFLFGFLAIVALKNLISNTRILSLNLRGHTIVRNKDFKRYRFYRSLFEFILASTLAVVITFLEVNLEEKLLLSEELVTNSNTCRRVDEYFDYFTNYEISLPQRYSLDNWSISITKELGCENGISSIDFAASVGNPIVSQPYAPVCLTDNEKKILHRADNAFRVSEKNLAISFEGKRLRYTSFEPYFEEPSIMMLSYDADQPQAFRAKFHDVIYWIISSCERNGIVSLPHSSVLEWEVANINSYNASRHILRQICEKHSEKYGEKLETVTNETLHPSGKKCWETESKTDDYGQRTFLNMTCLTTAPEKVYSVELDNIALMALDDRKNIEYTKSKSKSKTFKYVDDRDVNWAVKSFACPDVKVRIHYVLVEVSVFRSREKNDFKKKRIPINGSVLIHTKIDVIEGGCEPAFHAIATPALVHTANIELRGFKIDGLSRRQRYHAHTIALARQQFPVENVLEPKNERSLNCTLRKTKDATAIKLDWYSILVLVISIIFILMIIVNLIVKVVVWYRGWKYPIKEWIVARPSPIDNADNMEDSDEENVLSKSNNQHDMYQLKKLGEVEIQVSTESIDTDEGNANRSGTLRFGPRTTYTLKYSSH